MTGAYLRVKRGGAFIPVEVEHLTPEERRLHLVSKDAEALMRFMDIVCHKLVESEKLITELEAYGIVEKEGNQ